MGAYDAPQASPVEMAHDEGEPNGKSTRRWAWGAEGGRWPACTLTTRVRLLDADFGMVSDQELFGRWCDGDPQAADILLQRHVASLHRFLSSKVDNDVEDLLQDILLRCLEHRARFRGHSSFRTYVFAIARNAVFDRLRQRQGPRGRIDPGTISLAALQTSPVTAAGRTERKTALYQALRELPLDQQIAIELAYWEDLNATEIGEVLGVPPATVRTRLRRARSRLNAHLEALEDS